MWFWRASGQLEAVRDGEVISVSGRPKRLLGVLLASRGAPVDAHTIADRVWDDPLAGSIPSVRVTVNRLRSLLGPTAPIVTSPAGYQLVAEPGSVDLWEFERTVDSSSSLPLAEVSVELERAFALWRGVPFGEFHDAPWARSVSARLEELERTARERWAAAQLDLGRHDAIVGALEAAVGDEPFRERRWAQLMLALYRSGRQVDALRAFDTVRKMLIEELGVEPGPDLVALERRILRQDATLDVRSPSTDIVRDAVAASVVLGRRREVARIVELLQRHRAVIVVGLGGVGKTSVAQAAVRRARHEHVVVELAPLSRGEQISSALAVAVGLNGDGDPDAVFRHAAAELDAREAIVVFDGCEHLAESASAAMQRMLDAAPRCRIVATSRVPLHVAASTNVAIGPLSLGDIDAPGAAAQIVADHAGLSADNLRSRWTEIERAVPRSGGIPLALVLEGRNLGSGSSVVEAPPAFAVEGDERAVSRTIQAALDRLPGSVVDDLRRLAQLPDGFTIPFAAKILDCEERDVRYQIDALSTRGLVVADHRRDTLRVAVLEPVRQELVAGWPSAEQVRATNAMLAAVDRLASDAVGRWTEPVDRGLVGVLDDEHRNVEAALVVATSPPVLASIVAHLLPCWRQAGRSADAERIGLSAMQHRDELGDELLARLLVGVSVSTAEFTQRAVNLDNLTTARNIAKRIGNRDLEVRATAELVPGLALSGKLREADELLTTLESVTNEFPHPYTRSAFRVLRALLLAAAGRVGEAVEQTLVEAERLRFDVPDYSMGLMVTAAVMRRLTGDDVGALDLLHTASEFEVDRFTGHAHSRVAVELARIAVSQHAADAEWQLRRALVILDRYGDPRLALVCRRDLGRWLLTHGAIDEGAQFVADAVEALRSIDGMAAAVGLAALARMPGVDDVRQRVLVVDASRLAAQHSGLPLLPDERTDLEALGVIRRQ